MAQSVVCEICLEECQDDELEKHRKMCMASLMFRCAICDGDYMSKEGMWNHLDVHEIADDSKELHYQEMRASYKLNQCALCNDQRGYQENLFWKHVHEKHDGFILRCLECGESFRSHKLKSDHDLTYCKTREQNATNSLEADQEISNIVLPVQVGNTASLVSCGEMNENSAIKLEPSLGGRRNELGEHSKYSEINIVDQQVNQGNVIDSRLGVISPFYLNEVEDTHDITKKDSEVLSVASLKDKNESTMDAENILQMQAEKITVKQEITFEETTSILEEILPPFVHNSSSSNNQQEQIQSEHISLKMEITEEETSLLQHDEFGTSTLNPSTITDCPDLSAHGEVPEAVDSEINCSGQNSALAQERSDTHKKIDSSNVLPIDRLDGKVVHEQSQVEKIIDKKGNLAEETTSNLFIIIDCPICNEHFDDQKQVSCHVEAIHQMTMCANCGMTFASAGQLNDHKLSCLHLKHVNSQISLEEISQPYGDISLSGRSKTVCPHCGKDCCHEALLARHVTWFHQPIVCATCGITASGKHRLKYHKRKFHLKPKFECPHCSKKFPFKANYLRHVSTHVKEGKFPCKLCGRKYKSAVAIKDHMRRMHGLKEQQTECTDFNELEQEPQPCNDDGLIQGQKMELNMDIKVEETTLQEQDYHAKDEDCGKSPTATIISACQLKARKLKHRVKSKFSCNKCNQTLHGIKAFQAHVNKHVNKQKQTFHCSVCDRQLENQRKLQSHMAREHKSVGIQCKCPICGVTVSSVVKLRYHKLKYHTEKNFKCPHCPRKFVFEKVALAHMRIHKYNATKRLISLKARIHHRYGDNSKGVNHENEVKIKEEPLEDNALITPQSSMQSSQCHEAEDFMEPCYICGAIFETKCKLKYHRRVSHTEPTYKCSSCPLSFHFGGRLRSHEKVHQKWITCKLCSKKFKDQLCLERHLTNAHSYIELLCNKCNLKFTSRHELNNHVERFHTEPRFKCPDCGKPYHAQYALRNHMAIHLEAKWKKINENKDMMAGNSAQNQNSSLQNVESENLDHEIVSYTCQICESVFENNRRLRYHELVIHTEPQYKCSHCQKKFHSISKLNRHETTHSKILEGEVSLGCDLCAMRFPDRCGLQRHIAYVHPVSMISCSKCDLKFTTIYKLHYHESKFHTEGGFKCTDCGKLYNVRKALRRHMAVHLKEKQKKMKDNTETADQQNVESSRQSKLCSICGLNVYVSMEYHKRTAHTEPKHKCSRCPKMFYSMSKLNRHEITHISTLDGNVVCKMCPKTFRDEHGLQRHVNLNHPPSELPCDMCDLKFSTHSKLFYHVNTIHKPRCKCPKCDKPFITQSALQKHMTVHSKAKEEKHTKDRSERCKLEAKGEQTSLDNSGCRRSKRLKIKK